MDIIPALSNQMSDYQRKVEPDDSHIKTSKTRKNSFSSKARSRLSNLKKSAQMHRTKACGVVKS